MHKKFLRTLTTLAVCCWIGTSLVQHRANAMDRDETENFRIVIKSTSDMEVHRATIKGKVKENSIYKNPEGSEVKLKELEGWEVSFQPTCRKNKLRTHHPVDTTLKMSWQEAIFEFSMTPHAPGSLTFYCYASQPGSVLHSDLSDSLMYYGTPGSINKPAGTYEREILLEFPNGLKGHVGQSVKGYHTLMEIFDRWDETNL